MPGFIQRFARFALKSFTIIRDNFIPVGAVSQAIGGRTGVAGLSSNVVMAPVFWIMRTFTEAVAVVERRGDRGLWSKALDHDAEMLIERPNPAYDGDALWKATVVSYVLDGNAYWLKVRNAIGEVIQLWYIPHWLITPIASRDGSTFIEHYEYRPGTGPTVIVSPRDLVHFRFGLDLEDPKYGLSPLRPLLREVMTDDAAGLFSESILRNMGIPGLVISPKSDAWKPSPEEADKLRDYFSTAFSGDRTGRPLVMKLPTDVAQFGFDPNKLMLGSLRDISEERVCAVLGVPAAVVGFGSGLQSTKVGATMRELRRLAWVQCLIPMQESLARQLTAQLLPDFVAQRRRFRFAFDRSNISAFPEDDSLKATRIANLFLANLLRADRAQEMLGLEVDPAMEVYAHQLATPAESEASVPTVPDPVDPSDDPDDDTKILEAIRHRWHSPTNGNGHH